MTTTTRARKVGQGSKWIRRSTRFAIYHRDGMRCVYCGCALTEKPATLDHLTPCELGGTNAPKNLVSACLKCNSSKQDLPLRAWLQVLRDRGVDTTGLAARIRRLVRLPLDRAEGRRLAGPQKY